MTFWRQLQMRLAVSRCGRIILHLLCLLADRRLRWHAAGVCRELIALVTPHECPSRVGRMAGVGGNQMPCVHRTPPVFSAPTRFVERFGPVLADSNVAVRHMSCAAEQEHQLTNN